MSPKEIAACLSTLTNHQELALGFQFSLVRRHQTSQHPLTRSVLPALSSLRFLGTHGVLGGPSLRIDLPLLDNVDIILTHLATFHAPLLSELVSRIKSLEVHHCTVIGFTVVTTSSTSRFLDQGRWLTVER